MATGGAKLPIAGGLPGLGLLAACSALLLSVFAAAPPPAAAAGPYEPNEAMPAAAGPLLLGQSYLAALESSGDRDFYFFHVTSAAATPVSVTVQNLGGGGS